MSLREKKEAQTRARILEAALQIFCEKGIEQADMTDIAKMAEVGRATLYRYYENKHALAVQLFLHIANESSEADKFEEIPADFTTWPAYDIINYSLSSMMSSFQRNPLGYIYDINYHIYASHRHEDPLVDIRHPWRNETIRGFLHQFDEIAQDGTIQNIASGDDFRELVIDFYNYLSHIALFENEKEEPDFTQLLERAEKHKNIILAGIRKA